MKKEQTVGYRPALSIWGLLLSIIPAMCLAEVDTHLAESLSRSLQEQGWQEYQSDDGSVIYRQPILPAEPDVQHSIADEEQRKRLVEALGERGWEAKWNPDGTLVLRTKAQSIPAETTSQSVETVAPADLIPDLPGFEYWRIVKSDDGATLFYPLSVSRGTEVSTSRPTPLGRCEGYQLNMERVSLPVDQWAEANELAQNWLTASGLQGLLVGKIRKVLRVYLVSLVEAAAPYGLEHQLAIRASDGRVMLLEYQNWPDSHLPEVC